MMWTGWEAVRRVWREEIWEHEVEQPGWRLFWLRPLQATTVVVREFWADKCLLRASALTYATLLSIVPLFAIMFALLKGFGAEIDLEIFILNHMALGSDAAVDAVFTYISNSNLARLGVFGLVSLILSVLALLSNIEESFNHIWRVSETRSLFRRFTDYFAVVTVGPVFILAAFSMTTSLASQSLVKHLLANPLFGPLLITLFKFSPYLFMWAAFTFLYLFMPNVKVRFRSALIGGIFGGTLWQLLQWGYLTFQFGVGRYNAIYGTMAALPIFMVWLYLSWLVVLLGVELTFVHQNLGTLRQEMVSGEINVDSRERAALGVLLAAGAAFLGGGRPPTQEQLAQQIGIPARLASRLLEQLVRLGFLVEVVTGAGEPAAYLPARPPETTTLAEILTALRGDGVPLAQKRPSAELQILAEVMETMRGGERTALAGVTVQQLIVAAGERRAAGGDELRAI